MTQARDGDRDTAIDLVRSACASGRIIEADRDMRIEQLKHARTVDEIAMYVRDIVPDAAPPQPSVTYGPPTTSSEYVSLEDLQPKLSAARIIVPLVFVLVMAVIGIGAVVAYFGAGLSDGLDSVTGAEPDVLSADGYQDLLAAVEEETGSTEVFSATLYPTYAALELPVDRNSRRSEYWNWDGDLETNGMKTTSSAGRVDLSRIDPAVFAGLIEQVRANVEDPTTWYVIVRAPDDDRSVMWVYASNDYGETAYVGARRNGTVTYDSTDY